MHQAFEAIDQGVDGYIDDTDVSKLLPITFDFQLEQFFGVWKVAIKETDVYALIERFDRSHDGRIAFHEFVEELTI